LPCLEVGRERRTQKELKEGSKGVRILALDRGGMSLFGTSKPAGPVVAKEGKASIEAPTGNPAIQWSSTKDYCKCPQESTSGKPGW
jgi:hypothetical protein